MATLKFKGPFHWDHIDKKNNQLTTLLQESYGIYIWGFMFNITNGKILELVDFCDFSKIPNINECILKGELIGYKNEKWIFIPYYIGRARFYITGNDTLLKRIGDHHNIIKGDSLKYTRLSMSYYKSFFNDEDFPLPTSKSDWIETCKFQKKINIKYIKYFNNSSILKKIYPNEEPKGDDNHWPINDQNYITEDTLERIVNKKGVSKGKYYNNFWFCFLDISTKSDTNSKDKLIEMAEPQTFYSLNGKTVSKTKKFQGIDFLTTPIYSTKTCEYLFKTKAGRLKTSNHFKGYLRSSHFNQLADQLKNSKLTVKYSEANGNELACEWKEKNDNDSLLVIYKLKINGEELSNRIDKAGEIREKIMKDFLNPKVDDSVQTILKRNLMDILDESYLELDKFVREKRGFRQSKKFGF